MTALSEIRRVAAEQEWPRLSVWKAPNRGVWWWEVYLYGEALATYWAPTHEQALAVGLAALESASVRAGG